MADDGAGASITFGTSATTIAAIRIQEVGLTRAVLDQTHHGTTGGYKVFAPADFKDPGGLQVDFYYDPDTQPPEGPAETVTVTYPVPTGKNNGATAATSAFVETWDGPPLEIDSVMQSTMTLKRSGPISRTDATT